MVEQEILDTFVYETLAGSFVAIDPTEHDGIIGYYETKTEADTAFNEFITRENIIFE
jgi:hypothetical protein